MQIIPSHDIKEAITRIGTKKEINLNGDMDETISNEGENFNADTGKSSSHSVGEDKNKRVQSQVLCDYTTDFRFGLDKVNSEL